MAKRFLYSVLTCLAGLFLSYPLQAQDTPPTVDVVPPLPQPYKATPAHMWELGLHGGAAIGFEIGRAHV